MPAMLSFMRECGSWSEGNNARWALRIRVNMSEIGSVIALPACFGHSWNQPVQRGFAKGQARETEFAQKTVAASAHRTTIDQTAGAGVTRELGQAGIVFLRLQFRANGGILFHRCRL